MTKRNLGTATWWCQHPRGRSVCHEVANILTLCTEVVVSSRSTIWLDSTGLLKRCRLGSVLCYQRTDRQKIVSVSASKKSRSKQQTNAHKSCVSSMFSFSLWHRDSLLPPGFMFLALQLVRRSFNSRGLSTSPSSVAFMAPTTQVQA